MKYGALALSVFAIATLSGQRKSSSFWQNLCFDNPGSPVCKGRDMYSNKTEKRAGGKSAKDSGTSASGGSQPSSAADGQIDWRFADPGADALVGFDVSAIRDSAPARGLLLQIASQQGMKEADLQKTFELLKGVDQIVVSVTNNRAVAMLVGAVQESMFPAPEPGLRAVELSANALLFGRSDLVSEARQRMTASMPFSEVTAFADDHYGENQFWAIAQPGFGGPQAANAGIRRLTLAVSMEDQLNSDFGLLLFAPPSPEKQKTWQPTLGNFTVEGNSVRARRTIGMGDAQQKLADFLAGPLGAPLGRLISAARYLQPGDAGRPRAVIVGLDN